MISGGFDPLHIGHLALIRDARTYGLVVVALNSDEWLVRKKGYVFMSWNERYEILKALSDIHEVYSVSDGDGTVTSAILKWKPAFFINGGDRLEPIRREEKACNKLDVIQIFHAGGGGRSSHPETS